MLTVLRDGEYEGGEYQVPEYELSITLAEGGLLLSRPNVQWHGTRPFRSVSAGSSRVSVVMYLSSKLLSAVGDGRSDVPLLPSDGRSKTNQVELYCLCKRPFKEGVMMVGCDGPCQGWFHPGCVGLADISVSTFRCPACVGVASSPHLQPSAVSSSTPRLQQATAAHNLGQSSSSFFPPGQEDALAAADKADEDAAEADEDAAEAAEDAALSRWRNFEFSPSIYGSQRLPRKGRPLHVGRQLQGSTDQLQPLRAQQGPGPQWGKAAGAKREREGDSEVKEEPGGARESKREQLQTAGAQFMAIGRTMRGRNTPWVPPRS